MNEFVKAIILGAIQGATEFLPVSSSGHLMAAERVLGFEAHVLPFEVALHLATLGAVFIYFARYLWNLLRSSDRWPIGLRVVIGTIPAGIIGMAFEKYRDELSLWVVVVGWLLSGTYLLLTRREGISTAVNTSLPNSFLIGGSQGIAAVIPGFSRSGASIASGLWLGLKREEAFRFSFLLAIPVILGAGLVEGRKLFGHGAVEIPGGWPALAAAMLVAFAVGLLAIHILFKAVTGRHFHRFGWYNLSAAALFAIYLLTH